MIGSALSTYDVLEHDEAVALEVRQLCVDIDVPGYAVSAHESSPPALPVATILSPQGRQHDQHAGAWSGRVQLSRGKNEVRPGISPFLPRYYRARPDDDEPYYASQPPSMVRIVPVLQVPRTAWAFSAAMNLSYGMAASSVSSAKKAQACADTRFQAWRKLRVTVPWE